MRAAVGASSFAADSDKAMNLLAAHGIEVVKNPYGRKMNQEEIIEHLQGADALLAGLEPLNEEVFSKAPELKAIARIGIGMDNIDLKAAEKYGIKVSNTPEGPTNAVAEMVLAALLAIGRQIVPADRDMHEGIWKKRMGFSIAGLRILIVGYGHIGRKVGEVLSSLHAELLIYDKYNDKASNCTLEEGLKIADVVTLHASGRDQILTEERLALTRPGAVILNSARGELVDEEALYRALKSGHLRAYWGDVFQKEPYHGKLAECANALLTPHISTYTVSCRESMELQAAINLLEDLKNV